MDKIYVVAVMLATTAASLGAITSFVFTKASRRHGVLVRIGDIKISIEGDLTSKQANHVVGAITNALGGEAEPDYREFIKAQRQPFGEETVARPAEGKAESVEWSGR
jgi:hypothetical protein